MPIDDAASGPRRSMAFYETCFRLHSPARTQGCFIYFDDDGNLVALRYGHWKAVFMEQRCAGTLQLWAEPFTTLRIPKLYNLRTDPFEQADTTSNTYWDWHLRKGYMLMAAQALVVPFLDTSKEFPPRQRAASFTIDQALQKMEASLAGGH